MGFAGTDCGEAGVVLIPAHWGWSNDRIPPYPAAGGLLEAYCYPGWGSRGCRRTGAEKPRGRRPHNIHVTWNLNMGCANTRARGVLTRVFSEWESVAAAGWVGLVRAWLGQARLGPLLPAL